MEKNSCNCNNDIDHGPYPYITNIDAQTKKNKNYRTALWTGNLLQMTLMSIPVGSDIGAEIHEDTDQFLRIVSGVGMVQFGTSKATLANVRTVNASYGIFVPAGTWHNIKNIGNVPLKIYSVYAPPHHPFGTVEKFKS